MSEKGYEVEKEAIRKAILDYYSKGHDTCDPALYEEILHPEWRFMLFDGEGELMIVDRSEYYSWYNPQDADPHRAPGSSSSRPPDPATAAPRRRGPHASSLIDIVA